MENGSNVSSSSGRLCLLLFLRNKPKPLRITLEATTIQSRIQWRLVYTFLLHPSLVLDPFSGLKTRSCF